MSPTVLTRLREEHRRFGELLTIVERQLAGLEAGRRPDLGIMGELLDDLTGIAGRHHEWFEDQLFRRLAVRVPRYGPRIAGLGDQRRRVMARGMQTRDAVRAVLEGRVLRRERIVRPGRIFVSRFRALMRREETEMFPWLVASLQPADWVELVTACHWLCGMPEEAVDYSEHATVRQQVRRRVQATSHGQAVTKEPCPVCDYG